MSNETKQPESYVICDRCAKVCKPEGNTLGYGYYTSPNGTKFTLCFACCGLADLSDMRKTGKAMLYLDQSRNIWRVSNWPDSIGFKVTSHKRSFHNIARYRYDVWFYVNYPDGHTEYWHGYQCGDNTQICHCKRLKN